MNASARVIGILHSAFLILHFKIGCQARTRTKTSGLTGRRATLTPPGNGAAGRSSTCIAPLRRRMPHVFGHGSTRNGLMECWIDGFLVSGEHPTNPLIQSSITPFENGQRGRICTWCLRTVNTLGPKPRMLLLHHALSAPAMLLRRAGDLF